MDVPSLPPPPSRDEDVEHWARAMIVDASCHPPSPRQAVTRRERALSAAGLALKALAEKYKTRNQAQ